jgi:hypothetical protein
MEIQIITVDALTTEIRWASAKQGTRIHREQFCGRTQEETQKHVDERLLELQGRKQTQ